MRHLLPLLALALTTGCVIETEIPDEPAERPDIQTPAPRDPAPPAPTPEADTPGVDTPAPTCDDDALEPNDTLPTAADGLFEDLTLSAGDIDRFQLTLFPGETLHATTWFTNADGNLDLYALDEDGAILAHSTTDADGEDLVLENEGDAALRLTVETNLFEAPADTCLGYDLELFVEAAPTPPAPTPTPFVCADDAAEPDDVWDDATPLQAALDSTTWFERTAADDDWMLIDAEPYELLEIVVHHDTPGTVLHLEAWDAAGSIADRNLASGTNAVVLADGGPLGQTIDLHVAPTAPDTCAPYTVEVASYLPVCDDDLYEPNDVVPVATTAPVAVTLYEGDVDRFAIDVFPGEELLVDALFDHASGNVDLELFDTAGFALDWSTSDTDDESLFYFNDTALTQELTVEVTLYDATPDTCQDVTLDWLIFPPACYDDLLEGNDTPAGATELAPSLGTSVAYDLVADDDDFFWLETLPYEAVEIWIEHDSPGVVLDLAAYDAWGEVDWALADQPWQAEVLTLPVTATGDVYDLEVLPLAGPGTCLPYTLTVVSW